MTWKELGDEIAALPPCEQDLDAIVWPPGPCPAAESVTIEKISRLLVADANKSTVPVMTTGKDPA
jgi:hypothetical protein